MYDPMTVAFTIRYPWRKYGRKARTAWERGYRAPFITIWHVDPERDAGERGTKGDDTCGWFHPPSRSVDRERIRKIGEEEFRDIFGRLWAESEAKDYADVCYVPSTYDAIYWAWRRIKYESRKRYVWKYGRRWRPLTRGELDEIYSLASNPVDNLRVSVREVKTAKDCGSFFLTVYRCYLRHHRPWWRHPRWHVWHWSFQIHPWQALRRWLLTRCARCGKRFPYGYSPVSHSWDSPKPKFLQGEVGLYHQDCSGAAMADAKLHAAEARGSA